MIKTIKNEMLVPCTRCKKLVLPSTSRVIGINWCGSPTVTMCNACSDDIYKAFNVPKKVISLFFTENEGALKIIMKSKDKCITLLSLENETQIEMIKRGLERL